MLMKGQMGVGYQCITSLFTKECGLVHRTLQKLVGLEMLLKGRTIIRRYICIEISIHVIRHSHSLKSVLVNHFSMKLSNANTCEGTDENNILVDKISIH